jgi:hypothetical protein
MDMDMDMEEDKDKEEESSRKRSDAHIFVEDEPPYDLCVFLSEEMVQNDDRAKFPKTSSPQWQSWCLEMDRLMRIDKRTEHEVAAMISFCQQDEFWMGVIHSPANLRKNFPKIYAAAKKAHAPLELGRDNG